MKTYASFLKVMALLIALPIGISLIVLLGLIGFGIDFGNTGSGDTGTAYMFVLPLGFIAITAWIIYARQKRNSTLKTQEQEINMRQQIYREQELGTDPHEVVINILTKHGDKTAAELSQLLGVDQEHTQETIRELLQEKKIRQDVNQSPARFYVAKANL